MRALVAISIFMFSMSVWADTECVLNGSFKGNADKTLADYMLNNTLSSTDSKRALTELFSSVTHEWRCSELRSWHSGYETSWEKITVSQTDSQTVVVSFSKNRKQPDLKLIFEGGCYKKLVEHKNFYEYFCPVDD